VQIRAYMQFNALVVCFLCAIPLLGQSATDLGQIIGVVKDPGQAVISAAQVTLTGQQTKTKTTAVTDAQAPTPFGLCRLETT
jgi:hypothetical protein